MSKTNVHKDINVVDVVMPTWLKPAMATRVLAIPSDTSSDIVRSKYLSGTHMWSPCLDTCSLPPNQLSPELDGSGMRALLLPWARCEPPLCLAAASRKQREAQARELSSRQLPYSTERLIGHLSPNP